MSRIVFCIEGCHGVGKSTLLDMFSKETNQYVVIRENFLELEDEKNGLPLFSTIIQFQWLTQWFLKVAEGLNTTNKPIMIDRSPYSSLCYMKDSYGLADVIENGLDSLQKLFDVEFVMIRIDAPIDIIKKRIQKRIRMEQKRINLQELDMKHLKMTVKWYDSHLTYWNATLNNEGDLDEVFKDFTIIIEHYFNSLNVPKYKILQK